MSAAFLRNAIGPQSASRSFRANSGGALRLAVGFASSALLSLPAVADLNVVQPWKEEYVYTRPGTSVEVLVHATIQDGYRVVASTAKHPRLLALGLTMEKAQDVEIGAPRYPAPLPAQLGGQKVAAYKEILAIRIPIRIADKAALGERTLTGLLRYQACNEKACLPAVAMPVEISLLIEKAATR